MERRPGVDLRSTACITRGTDVKMRLYLNCFAYGCRPSTHSWAKRWANIRTKPCVGPSKAVGLGLRL